MHLKLNANDYVEAGVSQASGGPLVVETVGASEVEVRIGELYTLREGTLVRGQAFAEREQALEAVGLSE